MIFFIFTIPKLLYVNDIYLSILLCATASRRTIQFECYFQKNKMLNEVIPWSPLFYRRKTPVI